MKYLTTALFACALMFGCGDDGGGSSNGGKGTPPPPTLAPAYQTTGTWDLRGPLGGDHSVGDIIADLLVDEVVERAVPSLLRDRARDALNGRLRQAVKDFVNQRTPMDLAPGGTTYEALSASLANVQITTSITLTGETTLSGTERLLSVHVPVGADTVEVPLEALAKDGESGVVIEATLEGRMLSANSLELNPHGFELRYGRLIAWIVDSALGIDLIEGAAALDAAVDCADIAAALVGDGLSVEIAGQNISISIDPIVAGCEAVKSKVSERVLGLVSKDSGVSVGGQIDLADSDADGLFELSSAAGYGGEFIGLPGPIDLVVEVTFSGTPSSPGPDA